MKRFAIGRAAIAALAALVLGQPPAAAAPSDGDLVWVGVGLALPTYALGVTLHEGTHALAAKAMGAEVLSIDLLPGRDDAGAFHFGLTRVRGLATKRQKAFFYLAPKLTDALLLGGFTGLVLSDAGWPDNRYGQLTLTVLATGFWVDFTKDVLSFSPQNDVIKVMHLGGLTSEGEKLPARLGYATLAVTLGYFVVRGYQRTFEDPEAASAARSSPRRLILPVLSATF